MSSTDFPKAAARVSEGFCPLCDGELGSEVPVVVEAEDVHVAIRATEEEAQAVHGFAGAVRMCAACEVGFGLRTIEGRVVIVTSRTLRPAEIKRLHNRGDG